MTDYLIISLYPILAFDQKRRARLFTGIFVKDHIYMSLFYEVNEAHLHEGTIANVKVFVHTYGQTAPLAGSRRLRSRRANGNRKH